MVAGGLAAIALVVWFFWLVKSRACAPRTAGGYQEPMVLVKGAYTSDVVIVEHGKPLRLNFVRAEASCSETVLLLDFGKSTNLPDAPGEYEFHCQMGMLLIVE